MWATGHWATGHCGTHLVPKKVSHRFQNASMNVVGTSCSRRAESYRSYGDKAEDNPLGNNNNDKYHYNGTHKSTSSSNNHGKCQKF